MSAIKAVVVACDMVTPYGWGTEACWNGLLSGKTALGPVDRFETRSFQTKNAGLIRELESFGDESPVMQMLTPLLTKPSVRIPGDSGAILATTNGEISILEKSVLDGKPGDADGSRMDILLDKLMRLTGVRGPGIVVSATCASSSAAVAQAAAMISGNECDCVLVMACDCVSEFIFAGFSSLMALDKDMAKPFDKGRRGLTIGEAAGFILMMSESRALREDRPIIGEVAGWGLTCDANHMTGPSRDGSGLAMAIHKSLKKAGISEDAAGSISAHGTGTVYNDSMEMKAFKSVFKTPLPTYSIKGGIGHTMGAAGLLEVIIGFQTLHKKMVPPTVNVQNVDEEARGWVSAEPNPSDSLMTVSTNSGFGGVNCSLVLVRET
ncbi:beta-ketoacyl synthase N-terminal-like domain-containing protein [Desulfococcaceae bacterium HSG8]|nr:beta-ketoacyl synthase N-terminal-like domain-containing protein [Desulfococcaceae bacterium HSG8]